MRIDAHQHYWKLNRGDYGWITPDMPILNRDYLPQDLGSHLEQHQLDGSICIQAAPTVEETEYILSLSEEHSSILGVVGWLDLSNPNFKRELQKFERYPKFKGIRIMIQDMKNPMRVLESDYVKALTYFAEKDVPVDLLVTYEQLPVLIELLEKVPHLRGVVDHLAKPPIFSGLLDPWREQMNAIASHSKIYCKLSGMVTEADSNWQKEDFLPYVSHIVECFGTKRIMYGSDWPVCLLAGNYDCVYNLLGDCLPKNISSEDKTAIFGGNAITFYKL